MKLYEILRFFNITSDNNTEVNDIVFDYGIFTNLSQDHISEFEHSDMDDYVNSKSKLFKQCVNGIFNVDDEYSSLYSTIISIYG